MNALQESKHRFARFPANACRMTIRDDSLTDGTLLSRNATHWLEMGHMYPWFSRRIVKVLIISVTFKKGEPYEIWLQRR